MSDSETPHRVPILPYDFNMPPMADGRYWVSLRWSLWPLRIGEHVRFGSAADGCEAYGRVVGLSDKGVLVELDEWIASVSDRETQQRGPFPDADQDAIQLEPLPARDRFLLLRIEADACARLEYELQQRRESRDRIALRLVDEGYTWRDVASVAGFKNPYIATLKKRGLA